MAWQLLLKYVYAGQDGCFAQGHYWEPIKPKNNGTAPQEALIISADAQNVSAVVRIVKLYEIL